MEILKSSMNKKSLFPLLICLFLLSACAYEKAGPYGVHWNTYNSYEEMMIGEKQISKKVDSKGEQGYKLLAFNIDVDNDFATTYSIRGVCYCGRAKKHDQLGNCPNLRNRYLFAEHFKDNEYITIAFKRFATIDNTLFEDATWKKTSVSQLARHGSEIYVLQNNNGDTLVGLLFDSIDLYNEYGEYFFKQIENALNILNKR